MESTLKPHYKHANSRHSYVLLTVLVKYSYQLKTILSLVIVS